MNSFGISSHEARDLSFSTLLSNLQETVTTKKAAKLPPKDPFFSVFGGYLQSKVRFYLLS